jgi:hypothetical protein
MNSYQYFCFFLTSGPTFTRMFPKTSSERETLVDDVQPFENMKTKCQNIV